MYLEVRRRLVSTLQEQELEPGDHIPERIFANLGFSRGPIRKQLAQLASEGFLEAVPNKGYYIKDLSTLAEASPDEDGSEEQTYSAVASDCINGELPQQIMLNELLRRYDAPKRVILRVMTRIEREGWAEKRPGRGWSFSAQISDPNSYRQIYAVRRAIESEALLYEGHQTDPDLLQICIAEQKAIVDGGFSELGPGTLFAMQSAFHERLMRMSGNPYFIQTFERLNSLSRLATYRREIDRERVRSQSRQHLEIAEAILAGNKEHAALLMRAHLGGQDRKDMEAYLFDDVGTIAMPRA